MTKFKLFVALAAAADSDDCIVTINSGMPNSITGRVIAIEKEDGSGNKFNVTLALSDGTKKIVFTKTVD